MNFADMEKINVTQHVEKKGKFSYLSWPFAVAEFRKACPDGYWEVKHHTGLPYFLDDAGAFVHVVVYPDKESAGFPQFHPVLDHSNRPIKTPNPFQVNTSIQRALVKAIATATGIGLHIYAGEDLPPDDNGDRQKPTPKQPPKKKPPAKQPPKKTWTDVQKKKLIEMSTSFSMAEEDKVMFAGWLAIRCGVETWDDIPSIGKAGYVVSNFDKLYDEFMLEQQNAA